MRVVRATGKDRTSWIKIRVYHSKTLSGRVKSRIKWSMLYTFQVYVVTDRRWERFIWQARTFNSDRSSVLTSLNNFLRWTHSCFILSGFLQWGIDNSGGIVLSGNNLTPFCHLWSLYSWLFSDVGVELRIESSIPLFSSEGAWQSTSYPWTQGDTHGRVANLPRSL